jgi:hypothetical protein
MQQNFFTESIKLRMTPIYFRIAENHDIREGRTQRTPPVAEMLGLLVLSGGGRRPWSFHPGTMVVEISSPIFLPEAPLKN